MKEYLKMSDVFDLPLGRFVDDGSIGNVVDKSGDGVIYMQQTTKRKTAENRNSSAEYAAHAINSHDELVAEVGLLRSVCAEAYQMAGALDAPVEVLDNLSAAANGEHLPHETFLPVASHDLIAEIERLRDALQDAYLDGCHYGWGMSAEGYNAEHGGPNDGRLHNQFIESYSVESYTAA